MQARGAFVQAREHIFDAPCLANTPTRVYFKVYIELFEYNVWFGVEEPLSPNDRSKPYAIDTSATTHYILVSLDGVDYGS